MAFVLRNASIDARSDAGDFALVPDQADPSSGTAYVLNSTFQLGQPGEITVEEGEIQILSARTPRLIVTRGHLSNGSDIGGREYDLPLHIGIREGSIAPATPISAFPEGQTDAREAPRWLGRVLYGKAR
jgi:hypothetical protein